ARGWRGSPADPAVRRRAAAGRDCPGARGRTERRPRRRADREPRLGERRGGVEGPRAREPSGSDDRHGHALERGRRARVPDPPARGRAGRERRGGRRRDRGRGARVTRSLEYWRIALGALRANWFRAALTALGVVIGVAALIAVTAISAGAQREVSSSIQRLGGNVVNIDGEFISIGTTQSATDRTLTPEDVAAISRVPGVDIVAPHQDIESLTVSAGRHKTTTWLVGATAGYSSVQNQHAASGRLISAADVDFGRSVVLLGLVTARALFPGESPIGKTVRVGSHEFEVIG